MADQAVPERNPVPKLPGGPEGDAIGTPNWHPGQNWQPGQGAIHHFVHLVPEALTAAGLGGILKNLGGNTGRGGRVRGPRESGPKPAAGATPKPRGIVPKPKPVEKMPKMKPTAAKPVAPKVTQPTGKLGLK